MTLEDEMRNNREIFLDANGRDRAIRGLAALPSVIFRGIIEDRDSFLWRIAEGYGKGGAEFLKEILARRAGKNGPTDKFLMTWLKTFTTSYGAKVIDGTQIDNGISKSTNPPAGMGEDPRQKSGEATSRVDKTGRVTRADCGGEI